MKMSMREKIMIAVFFVAAWIYVANRFLIVPATDDLKSAQTSLDNLQMQQISVRAKIDSLSGLAEKEQAELARIDQSLSVYYPDYIEENILNFVHNLAEDSDLSVTTIASNGISLRDLDSLTRASGNAENAYLTGQLAQALIENEDDGDTAASGNAPAAAPPASGRSGVIGNAAFAYSFRIDFKNSTYDQLMSFLKGFEDLGMLTAVNGVSVKSSVTVTAPQFDFYDRLIPGATTTAIEGSFTVNLMAVDSVVAREAVFPDVEFITPAGKENPFISD